jgi:hypothetical protein
LAYNYHYILSTFGIFGTILFSENRNEEDMENRKEQGSDKRRRKVMSRPVLVRSERPGQVAAVANYSVRRDGGSIWKDA